MTLTVQEVWELLGTDAVVPLVDEPRAVDYLAMWEFVQSRHPDIDLPGFECMVGWFPLLDDLLGKIEAAGVEIDVGQVKEKFGGLRFYAHPMDWEADEGQAKLSVLIKEAEEVADRTCEVCGRPGEHRLVRGWHSTLCEHHADQRARTQR